MKQKTIFVAMLMLFGSLLLACSPQVETVAEPAEVAETGSEMAEDAHDEESEADHEEGDEADDHDDDDDHSDEAMAEAEMEDEAEMAEESQDEGDDEAMDEAMMEEGGEAVYTVSTADSVLSWKGAKAVGNSHTGVIDISEGTLVLADGSLVSGSFVIDMSTIASTDGANARLVQHLKNDDFFGVDTFPTASLVINSAESLGGDQFAVVGDLTIKEITHPIEFTATATEANGQVSASADIVFDRALYDVQYASGSFFDNLGNDLINDEIEITVELVATQ